MSIHDISYKIKGRVGIDHITLINIIVIILVGICAFGLGRLSVESPKVDESVKITNASGIISRSKAQTSFNSSTETKSGEISLEGQYVASKNGKLYYSVGCSGANRIKKENKIWFDTKEEAEKYGLIMSSTCK